MDWNWLGPLPGTAMLLWAVLAVLAVIGGAWLLARLSVAKRNRGRPSDALHGPPGGSVGARRGPTDIQDEIDRRRKAGRG